MDTLQPYFSIIIPVYNRETFLKKTITSVLEQIFEDFEVICIDDGSTDNSLKMLTTFQNKDSRVKLISFDKNRGRCIARNYGMSAASGKWICFLDSDDYYLENHLSTLYTLTQEKTEYSAFSVNQKVTGVKTRPTDNENRILTFKDFLKSNAIQINQLCISSKIDIRFPNERIPISEDWLFMRNLSYTLPIYWSPTITNVVINHDARSMHTTDWLEFVKWNEYTGVLFSKNESLSTKSKNKVLSFTYLLCTNILLSKGLKKHSFSYFYTSLQYINSYFEPLFYRALIKLLFK